MTYSTISALCKAEKLDKQLIRAASKLGLAGFNANRTISWEILKAELEKHKDALERILKDKKTKEELVLEGKRIDNENKRLDSQLKALEIKRREANYIDPAEWYQWHSQFGTRLSTAIKTVRTNLMAKCCGYEFVIDGEMLSLFTLVKNAVEECRK
jgi:hypothetical protein